MVVKNVERQLPPYVPYRTWNRFLERIKEERPLPTRLDSSFWARLPFSGSSLSAVKRALLFLNFINAQGLPSENLEKLLTAQGNDRTTLLSQTVHRAYADLLSQIDLARATRTQLRDYFKSMGADGKVGHQCVSFFIAIAKEAGIELHRSLQSRVLEGKQRKRSVVPKAKLEDEATLRDTGLTATSSHAVALSLSRLHPAILGLLMELPGAGAQWAEKLKWKQAWDALIDLIYPP